MMGPPAEKAHGTGEGVIHIDGHIPDFGAEEVLIAVKIVPGGAVLVGSASGYGVHSRSGEPALTDIIGPPG